MMLMIRPSVGDVVYITLLLSHDLIPDTQFRLARLEVKFKVNYRGTRVLAIKAPPLPKRRSATKTLQFHVAAKNLHQKTTQTSKQQHKTKADMTLSMYIKTLFLFLFCVVVVCFLISLPDVGFSPKHYQFVCNCNFVKLTSLLRSFQLITRMLTVFCSPCHVT